MLKAQCLYGLPFLISLFDLHCDYLFYFQFISTPIAVGESLLLFVEFFNHTHMIFCFPVVINSNKKKISTIFFQLFCILPLFDLLQRTPFPLIILLSLFYFILFSFSFSLISFGSNCGGDLILSFWLLVGTCMVDVLYS